MANALRVAGQSARVVMPEESSIEVHGGQCAVTAVIFLYDPDDIEHDQLAQCRG